MSVDLQAALPMQVALSASALRPLAGSPARCSLTTVAAARRRTLTAVPSPLPNVIRFYRRSEPFFEFTNFLEGFPVVIDSVAYPTVEHFFQG